VEEEEEEANFSGASIATPFLPFLFCFSLFPLFSPRFLETAVISFHFCF
jgi:hypothetical protein